MNLNDEEENLKSAKKKSRIIVNIIRIIFVLIIALTIALFILTSKKIININYLYFLVIIPISLIIISLVIIFYIKHKSHKDDK